MVEFLSGVVYQMLSSVFGRQKDIWFVKTFASKPRGIAVGLWGSAETVGPKSFSLSSEDDKMSYVDTENQEVNWPTQICLENGHL